MNRKKRILVTIFVVILATSLFSFQSFATTLHQRTTAIDLTGNTSDGDPASDIDKMAEEGWKWTASTKTLTLDGFDMDVNQADRGSAIYLPSDSTIYLQNANKIVANDVCAISAEDSDKLTICGNGSLDACTDKSENEVICFSGSELSIKDCTLRLEAKVGYEAIYDSNDSLSLSIENANVTAIGREDYNAICVSSDINIKNSVLNAQSDSTVISLEGNLSAENSTVNAFTEHDTSICCLGSVSFNNCTADLTSQYANIYVDYGNISLTDTTLKAKSTEDNNFYVDSLGNIDINNSTLNLAAYLNNIYVCEGNINISGSTINAASQDDENIYSDDYDSKTEIKNSTLNFTSKDENIQCCGSLDIDNCKLTLTSLTEEGIDVECNTTIKSSIINIIADEDGIEVYDGDLKIESSIITIKSKTRSGITVDNGNLLITGSEVSAVSDDFCGICVYSGAIDIIDSYVIASGSDGGIASINFIYNENARSAVNSSPTINLITINNSDVDATSKDGGFGIVSMFHYSGDIRTVMPKTPTIVLDGKIVVLQGGAISSSYGLASIETPEEYNSSEPQLRAYSTNSYPNSAAYTFTPDGKSFSWNNRTGLATNVSPVVLIRTLNTLSFETNGGSEIAPLTDLKLGDLIKLPNNPTKAGETFEGWYLDKECTQKLPDNATYKRGMSTLYAKWSTNIAPTPVAKTDVPKTQDSASIASLSVLGVLSLLGSGFTAIKTKKY